MTTFKPGLVHAPVTPFKRDEQIDFSTYGKLIEFHLANSADSLAVPMHAGGCKAERELTDFAPAGTWTKLGVTLTNGKPLPATDPEFALVKGDKRHFLVTKNYLALIGYNCANSYAVSLGLLADAISQ